MTKVNDNLMILYAEATLLARQVKQVVGENRDYYITLEQLENLIKSVESRSLNRN